MGALPITPTNSARLRTIVIGASAGAVEALSAVLPSLPSDYPLSIVIVVHLPPHRDSALTELFSASCSMKVKEVEDKEDLHAGVIYFAAPDYHLLVEQNYRLSLSSEETVNFSRPSIDVLFESAADALGNNVIGIILSGANQDGAAGLKAIEEAGGVVIVQKPQEAYSSTMPEAALQACPTARSLSLHEISLYLKELKEIV